MRTKTRTSKGIMRKKKEKENEMETKKETEKEKGKEKEKEPLKEKGPSAKGKKPDVRASPVQVSECV